MYEKLKDEKLIVDITNLVDKVEKFEEDIDSYCEFMKGVILNTSGIN
ncbi:unknown [Clostridium sp. CAG:967]|nr:unknown [Clostridium sp. CAG:967]